MYYIFCLDFFFSAQSNQSETVLPVNEDQPEQNTDVDERPAVCAPQVRIDADGNVVLDEERQVFIAVFSLFLGLG